MSDIRFQTKIAKIGSWDLLILPRTASDKLPSRGMVMVEGTINGGHFQVPLEPDGKGSHWFRIDKTLGKAVNVGAGDSVALTIEPIKVWPNPKLPTDLKTALRKSPESLNLWLEITPMARWDWLRWVRSTKNPETRERRIEIMLSKLQSGKRRPCCFNRSICTETSVSKNGVLLDPV